VESLFVIPNQLPASRVLEDTSSPPGFARENRYGWVIEMVVRPVTNRILAQPNQSKTVLGAFSPEEAGLTTEAIHPVAPLKFGDGTRHRMSGRNFVNPKAL